MSEEPLEIESGKTFIHEGDPGGDLFFIKSGRVEVYTSRKGSEIRLTEMGEGEVLGLMSCVNKSPRLASVRAVADVSVLKISAAKFDSMMSQLPSWMSVVIKEFTHRIQAMNDLYAEQNVELQKLKSNQHSSLIKATHVADSLSVLGEIVADDFEGQKIIVLSKVIPKLAECFAYTNSEIEEFLELLCRGGVLKYSLHPDKQIKEKIVSAAMIERLRAFADFARKSEEGKNIRRFNVQVPYSGRKMLTGLIQFAKAKKMPLNQTIHIPIEELRANLLRVTGAEYNHNVLVVVNGRGFVDLVSVGDKESARFHPKKLSLTMSAIRTIRLFLRKDGVIDDPRLPKGFDRDQAA